MTSENIELSRILIVIPTLGERLDTLRRTLSSIKDQAGVLVDTVLVSTAQTPELSEIATAFGARVLVHPGKISAAVNAGFSEALPVHRYAGWLGDDDMLRPGALATASALLGSDASAVVAYGACDYVDSSGSLLFTRRPPFAAPFLLQFVPGLIKQEACLFRRSALTEVGGLDETLKYTMDLDLLLKLRRVGTFVKTEQVLAAFCWHAGSLTIANRRASLDEAQAVQCRHVRGIFKIFSPVWMYPIRYLIFLLNWKINKGLASAREQQS